jgi:hypothetical protein
MKKKENSSIVLIDYAASKLLKFDTDGKTASLTSNVSSNSYFYILWDQNSTDGGYYYLIKS